MEGENFINVNGQKKLESFFKGKDEKLEDIEVDEDDKKNPQDRLHNHKDIGRISSDENQQKQEINKNKLI